MPAPNNIEARVYSQLNISNFCWIWPSDWLMKRVPKFDVGYKLTVPIYLSGVDFDVSVVCQWQISNTSQASYPKAATWVEISIVRSRTRLSMKQAVDRAHFINKEGQSTIELCLNRFFCIKGIGFRLGCNAFQIRHVTILRDACLREMIFGLECSPLWLFKLQALKNSRNFRAKGCYDKPSGGLSCLYPSWLHLHSACDYM